LKVFVSAHCENVLSTEHDGYGMAVGDLASFYFNLRHPLRENALSLGSDLKNSLILPV